MQKIKGAIRAALPERVTERIELAYHDLADPVLHKREFHVWQRSGCRLPGPPYFKQKVVRDYGERFGIELLVETGTYLGEMVYAVRGHFDRVCTIELNEALYSRATQRFRRYQNVETLFGDSSTVLRQILPRISVPTLFWLDAHYSAGITSMGITETPIVDELDQILRHAVRGHVVLVDDARLFTGKGGWPSVHAIDAMRLRLQPTWEISVEADIIRMHAKERVGR